MTPVRIAENGYRLPDPLPVGTVLTDSGKRQWQLGESIGCGGFGEIYCAREVPTSSQQHVRQPPRSCVRRVAPTAPAQHPNMYPYVVKVDHMSGPLYAEMHFYHRAAKPKQIDRWMLTQRLAFLGMPRYVASGIHVRDVQRDQRVLHAKYRFLVLDRLGCDLQKVLEKQDNRLDLKSAYTIAMMTLDTLAYVHSFGYIHADIKASNLLLGRLEETPPARELYLVDYGLVERYRTQDGEHKEQEEDQRRANNGTIEFTSRDGHLGSLSRRSDLEILAYNVISWLSGGRLPWMDCKDHEEVRKKKVYFMGHIDLLLMHAFKTKSSVPRGLKDFVQSISRLGFKEDPDYAQLKLILTRAIVSSGYTHDGLISWGPKKVVKKGTKRPASSSPDFRRDKMRKLEILEFEQLDHCEIPRKMGRTRGVRSAPTTLTRQRTGSISPTVPDIESLNPTPQMLEVMQIIKQKQVQTERESLGLVSNLSCVQVNARKRVNSMVMKRGKTLKVNNKRFIKSKVPTVEANDFNTDAINNNSNNDVEDNYNEEKEGLVVKKKKRQKRIFTKRIPLRRLIINEKAKTQKRPHRTDAALVQSKKQHQVSASIKKGKQQKKTTTQSAATLRKLMTRSKFKVAKVIHQKELRSKFNAGNAMISNLDASPLAKCDKKRHRKRIK